MAVKILKPEMKALFREKERLEMQAYRLFEQSEAIRHKIEGIEIAISILEGREQKPEKAISASSPVSNVKGILLDLARETGASGINANIAVEMAQKKGIKLLRGTAASNLSRLKADNALVHDGKKYRLPEFTRPQLPLTVHTGGKSS